jgi:uncharacterized membrane protein
MNKQLLIPIVALTALVLKHTFNYEMPQAEMDTIADGILALVTLVGIFMKPNKD